MIGCRSRDQQYLLLSLGHNFVVFILPSLTTNLEPVSSLTMMMMMMKKYCNLPHTLTYSDNKNNVAITIIIIMKLYLQQFP